MSRKAGVRGDLVGSRNGWNSTQGDFSELEYEGDETYITSLYNTLRGAADVLDVNYKQQGTFFMLTVRKAVPILGPGPGGDTPVITVRQQINRVEKSIFEPPVLGDVTAAEAALVQKAIESQDPNDILAMVDAAALAAISGRPAASTAINALYDLGTAGVKSRQVNQAIIAVTRSAPRNYQWPDNGGWVGYNLDHGQMIANSGISGVLNFALPDIADPVTWSGLLFYYGWVKQEPYYDTSTADRSVEYLGYEFGLWPIFLYPLATF